MRRTGVCGAAETLLIDARVAAAPETFGRHANRGRLRSARDDAMQRSMPRAKPAATRTGKLNILDAIISATFVEESMRRSRTSTITARIIPTRS